MTKLRTSLAFSQWPEQDRKCWTNAISKGDFLEPDGRAAHWADATKIQVQKGYSKFLFFLDTHFNLAEEYILQPHERISRDRIHAYAQWLINQGLSSVTCASRMTDLCEALRVMCPEADIAVIKDAISVLQRRASPSRKKHLRILHPETIWRKTAVELHRIAQEASKSTTLLQACAYRDLMALGFLALRPIRLRNLAQLTLDVHLTRNELGWHCRFEASETKDHTELSFDLPTDPEFLGLFETYLKRFRPVLAKYPDTSDDLQGPLWISTRRKAMTQQALYWNICRLTERLFGHRINPHLLRDCAVSAISTDSPEHILMAARVLGHSSLNTTIAHYEQSSMLMALSRLNDHIHTLQIEGLEQDEKSDLFSLPFDSLDDEAA